MSIEHTLKKIGLAKNTQQANIIMLVIIIISLFFIFNSIERQREDASFDETTLSPQELLFIQNSGF